MYNQTLPHREEAMAETWEYHRNVAWTQDNWHSKNGTQPSFPVCTKGNVSDCLIISKIRQVACISRHHFVFLPWNSFQEIPAPLRRPKILLFHAWFLSPYLLWSLHEGHGQIWPGSFPFGQNSEFCPLLALTSTNIEKAYDMGIIRIYRSSITHWCKSGVHTLCCSHDRAVFPIFPNKNSSTSRKAVFPCWSIIGDVKAN